MDMGYKFLATETTIRGNIRLVDFTVRVGMLGKMVPPTMVVLWRAADREWADGNQARPTMIYTLGNTKMTRSLAKANTPGTMEQCMKETS